jgi:thiamine kinase-like enzyme
LAIISSQFYFQHVSLTGMTPEEKSEVQSIVADIPALQNTQGSIERLGGLTNRVYRVGRHVLRIPGKGTEEYINRSNEAASAHVAATAGVSPAILHADAKSGVMVTELITATTMSPQHFKTRVGTPARAGIALHKLHTSGGVFPFRFELFAMIDEYLGVLSTKDVELPDGYHAVVREAETIREALAKNPAPLAPCHCDPLCENFLDDGRRMWIVDWEYSGMNDPMWDLGDLSVEANFTDQQDLEMLAAYFNSDPPRSDFARMIIYKAMCDLLWTLWGLIQHANKNPADDFNAYALNRFLRCKRLMGSSDFARHLSKLAT